MWAEKLIEFQQALEQYTSAKCELCWHIKNGDYAEPYRQEFHAAKLKVTQLFNEQLTMNQQNYEANKTS